MESEANRKEIEIPNKGAGGLSYHFTILCFVADRVISTRPRPRHASGDTNFVLLWSAFSAISNSHDEIDEEEAGGLNL